MEVFVKNKVFLTGMAALLLSFGLILLGCPTDTADEKTDAAAPSITTEPASASYKVKATAVPLAVVASVTDGGVLSYQWYNNTTASTDGGTAIATATAAAFTPSTTAAGTFYYYVVVTNTNNSATGAKTATATSKVATITITKPAVTVTGVTVTAEKNADRVTKGETLQFSAVVTGNPTPAQTVTWSIKETGVNAGTTISDKGLLTVAAAETLATLTVVAASTDDPEKTGEKAVSVTAAVTP
jgi:hypothetical protein